MGIFAPGGWPQTYDSSLDILYHPIRRWGARKHDFPNAKINSGYLDTGNPECGLATLGGKPHQALDDSTTLQNHRLTRFASKGNAHFGDKRAPPGNPGHPAAILVFHLARGRYPATIIVLQALL
jgi:hypothetical protein